MAGRRMNIRKGVNSLLLVVAGCAAAVGLAEGVVRLIDPHARDYVIPGGFFIIDPAIGWRLRPQTTVVHKTRYFGATYTTNNLGYRDTPRTIDKQQGRTRILLYGDSLIFGWGVAGAERFSSLVEAERPNVEVWNHAVPGYGLDQQVLAYEKDGQGLNADVVVFFVSRVTVERTRTGYLYRKYKPQFVLDSSQKLKLIPVPQEATQWTSALYRFLSPWYLPYFLDRRIAMVKEVFNRRARSERDQNASQDSPLTQVAWLLLERAADVARVRGHRLVLLAHPPPPAWGALEAFCAERGIGIVTIDFPKDRASVSFGQYDRHWNARGNRLVADGLLANWTEVFPD
jgi:hypothetical protein